jgi:hypothetical protein
LKSVTFDADAKLEVIEESAFSETAIDIIVFPSSLVRICKSVFEQCHFLSSVSFEERSSLREIEDRAFFRASLKSILIPSSVTAIGESCFANCSLLNDIEFADTGVFLQWIEIGRDSGVGDTPG